MVAGPLTLSLLAYGQTGEDPDGDQQPSPELEEPAQRPPAQQTLATEVDDKTLDRFAKAAIELQNIQTSASTEMDQVGNAAEISEIQLRMQQEMTSAFKDAGLSVEEYNRIVQLMNSDEEIRKRITKRLKASEGS
ncbi:MAG: DUF4168 domain-containing protein [Gammaproteobacteria bacterium]|nr:DUF4168 domain-containing protein [Gammaproteobacteria bacterium]